MYMETLESTSRELKHGCKDNIKLDVKELPVV
jgi:hypothetical protein